MIHKMKLKTQYFNYIKNGTKRIEIRLNDEKRKKIKIGDKIEFLKYPELDDKIIVIVKDLLHYEKIEDMLNDNDISVLVDKTYTKKQLLEIFNNIYSKEEQKKYGILGIKIDII